MESVMRALFSFLPIIARGILAAQDAAGVHHPTVARTVAEWILRGDRRDQGTQPLIIPEGVAPRRLTDQLKWEAGAAQVPHGLDVPGGTP